MKFMVSTLVLLVMALQTTAQAAVISGIFKLDSPWYGPVQVQAQMYDDGKTATIRTRSGLTGRWPEAAVDMQISCTQTCQAKLAGYESDISIERGDSGFTGEIRGGSFSGRFEFIAEEQTVASVDYLELSRSIIHMLQQNTYFPGAMDSDKARKFSQQLLGLAAEMRSDLDMVYAMSRLWNESRPFSHVSLAKTRLPAEQMAAFVDGMNVGPDAVNLEIVAPLAILTVNTMMGQDTIDNIRAAFETLRSSKIDALIIDLRQNEGGAFAGRALIEHVIQQPLEAGYFVSRRWWIEHDQLPTANELEAIEPWTGWSVREFWAAGMRDGVLRVRSIPAEPHFNGKVYVLTSSRTASAAEFAVAALQGSGAARVIGEQTAGQMLSQTFFDLPAGFTLALPILDYYSAAHGRIEGKGVTPDIVISAESALAHARELAEKRAH